MQKYAKIAIRKNKDTFRDMGEIIDELSGKWKNLSDVEKNAIAKALSGKVCA